MQTLCDPDLLQNPHPFIITPSLGNDTFGYAIDHVILFYFLSLQLSHFTCNLQDGITKR